MDYEIGMAIFVMGLGFGVAGLRGLMLLLRKTQSSDESVQETQELMVGEQPPELPAAGTIHGQPPYRHTEGGEDEDRPDPFIELDSEDRFRRFAIAVNELGETIPASELERMAGLLEREKLLDVLEHDNIDTFREKAAVFAFRIRNDPDDMDAVADLIMTSDMPEVTVSALRCLERRAPVGSAIIAAVFSCIQQECPWGINYEGEDDDNRYAEDCDEDDDYEPPSDFEFKEQVDFEKRAVSMARAIMEEWKADHPQQLRDFVLNR